MAIDDRALPARVPALLLQPLVENAIRHGIATRVGSGRIEVEAVAQDASVAITVTDDGVGTEAEGGPERIGLGNTRARLRALHGEAARLDLLPVDGGGMRVRVVVPR
jgi:LytS/YehU family sensor histidine kinase